MSLIHFRGHSILPPLVRKEEKQKQVTDEQSKEDTALLSLPHAEALKYILCGLPSFSLNECKASSHELSNQHCATFEMPAVSESTLRNSQLNKENVLPIPKPDKKKNERKDSLENSFDVLKNKYDDKIKANERDGFHSNEKEMDKATESANNSLKHCPTVKIKNAYQQSKEFCESSPLNENSESSTAENLSFPCSSSSHKNLLSAVTNHQKLKVLKSSGTNSSTYLQDYLQLLTSRSHFTNVGKVKKGCESAVDPSLERRGSAPSLSIKKGPTTVRKRNASGSSDKSTLRSLGSTYLDSYLGNLTDHSWIIYPTVESVSDPSLKKLDNEKNAQTSISLSPSSKNGEHMHRRLQFINPEKFFNAVSDKKENPESLSQHTSVIKSNSSADNDHDQGLTDTSGIVISPDISASSLDTDKFDSSHALSTSLQDTPILEECQLNKDDQENVTTLAKDPGLTCNNEKATEVSTNVETKNEISISEAASSKIPSSDDGAVTKKENIVYFEEESTSKSTSTLNPHVHLDLEDLEFQEQEDLLNSGEESSVTSTDDAEDQVSMIVCGTQNVSGTDSNVEGPKHLYDQPDPSKASENVLSSAKVHKKKSTDELPPFQNSDSSEIFNNFSGVDNSISKLINMLRTKHEEELQELRNRHQQEMNNFVYQLLQLSATQRLALANNNSLNDVFNNLSGGVPQSCRSSEIVSSTAGNVEPQDSLKSPFNHTNLMPSFFLHEDNQDNDSEKRTDISKISQIFSPLRISSHNVQKKSVELSTLNQNALHKNMEDAAGSCSETGCSLSKENSEIKINPRKQITFTQRQFEVGLDLVPTRESDGVVVSSAVLNSRQHGGIVKLQAAVRGTRIRNLMKTSQVQQLLATLKEVAKLAHQFHHDILMDNIRKGDIDFHKALFNQEKQTREKFIDIMVEMNPVDQIRMIQKNRSAEQRDHRRFAERPKGLNPVSKSFLGQETADHQSASKNLNNVVKSSVSTQKGEVKQIPKRTFSELPRPCKTNPSFEAKSLKCTSVSSRSRQTLLSTPRGIPRRIVKKIEPNPQPHLSHRRQNAPICKTDPSSLGLAGTKLSKVERTSVTLRGDVLPGKKPWR